MTEQSYAVDVGHPPSALLRAVNPVLKALLGTPLAGPLRKQLMVLNFTGRKSGKQFSLPVSAHVIDGNLYALAGAAWKYNFKGGAPAQVVYDGKTTAMRGELLPDGPEIADLYHRCAQSYGPKRAQRMMGLKFRDDAVPTREEFAEAIQRQKLVAIKFAPVP
ncbi:hypothetical protein [Mycobacterium asiaticum]|uniref:Deazaflavin-dependent nitroreductase n=1 Tax=Mycobacterium asiaticum TaxID=1790 RepID=A0A1A3CM42_MYCAS|nr:hypothetical protein [Mycobacterium asiaticum]OBI88029.1 hypothetical protein A5661_07120 [Mycobacterium asiaticum]OBJ51746.1 hypothetical protein A9W94_25640 [Mycobacterium asiaticum]OBJ83686.1 hypothetical protein A5640_17650 [Mycobacterium asiaticum]ORA17850.1 hypothetical protein BST16_03015 [Mycobacterium asiaticum DSM 44297]